MALSSAEAIKCYHCNSANNTACLDVHLQSLKAVVPVVDCSRYPSIVKRDYFCRKITQTIFHNPDEPPDVRITRGCGWVRHKKECYKADNDGHLETVCQCFSDECNAAGPVGSAGVLASMLTGALYDYTRRPIVKVTKFTCGVYFIYLRKTHDEYQSLTVTVLHATAACKHLSIITDTDLALKSRIKLILESGNKNKSHITYLAAAIKCYYCNSANNSMCLDPAQYDDETRQRFLPVLKCEYGLHAPMNTDFFCRKIIQTIFHKEGLSEVRVNRGCGWVRDRRECYKADNEDHLETVCQCFTDGCNAAPAQVPESALAIYGLLVVLTSVVI
ncbi:hypothetical protein EVAR_78314_1 [Eumeta japonica]|uniref:Uncharacterized protein n=1 Tax=Eumeta variegata TaxID=151549 RepID=A0A4C1T6Q0_EUMVA|nr:hypothetical protein EVAR_78314_1 [Eumeta japonica]